MAGGAEQADIERRHRELLDGIRVRSRRIAWSTAVAAVALIPWTVYLAVTLPKARSRHPLPGRPGSGFDLLLAAAIVLTAYFALRMDQRVQIPATATATLLLVDAWFDVMTAGRRKAVLVALLMGVCLEIPAALFSLWLARRVNRNAALLVELDALHHTAAEPPGA